MNEVIKMTERENYLRTIEFRNSNWIPCSVCFSPATWHKYREKLEELLLRHPLILKDYKRGSTDFDEFPPGYREGEYYRDNWGCLWYSAQGGLEVFGSVYGRDVSLENIEALCKAMEEYCLKEK